MATTGKGQPILVTGAAGKTGRAVIRALVARQLPVRALVHRREQRQAVTELGAGDVVEGDVRSRETVAAAVGGVAAIYHICPNVHPDEAAIGRRVVSAALEAGVGHLVYHSVLHPGIEAMPHHWAKLRVEELLFASGLPYTILQPAPYMQNVLGQWRTVTRHALYEVPYGLDTRVVMVDLEDVADTAAKVLSEGGHRGATYELCGRELLDQRQIAAALGRAVGKEVRAQEVPRRVWEKEAREAGLDGYRLEALLAMFDYYEQSGMRGAPWVLERLLDRPATSFTEFLERRVAG